MLLLCQEAGLIKLGHVAIDGSKIKADASKHKAMSYERMKKDEERLRVEVEQLLNQSDEADADEDARYGAGSALSNSPMNSSIARDDFGSCARSGTNGSGSACSARGHA